MSSSTKDVGTLERRDFLSAGAVAIAATAVGGGNRLLPEEHAPITVRPRQESGVHLILLIAVRDPIGNCG